MQQRDDIYSFGPFALDTKQRVLLRGADPLRLTPKEVDVLVALVERHGELVDKSRLFEEVWRGVCVEECNLSQHVASLRRALGDDAREPTYIQTVPRRGYRFVAPVTRADHSSAVTTTVLPVPAHPDPPSPTTPEPSADAPPTMVVRRRTGRFALAALLVGVSLALGGALRRGGARRPEPTLRSIAVVPFANLTGDAHHDHLAETLTTALMNDLRKVTGLRVEVVRTGAGASERPGGFDGLVETALLSGEGRVLLAAELIDVRTNRLIWAEMLDSDPVSFLEAEDKIAQAVVSRLGPEVDDDDDRAAAQRECALARQYLSRRTPQVVREAIEHFTAAAERDASYAPAQAGIADAYLLGAEQRILPPSDALARAEAAARHALELDPRLAEAHAAFGEIAAARWDFEAAALSYRRALDLDPAIAKVHERYAALLTLQDRHEEAVAEARVARDLDPRSAAAATTLAAASSPAGSNDAALEQALAALRLTPRFAAAYDVLGWAHQAHGHDAEAIAAFREAVRLSDRSPTYVGALARALARAGVRDEARQLLSELERSARERAASPLDLAEVLAALGDTDEALRSVERAAADGAPWLYHVDAGLSVTSLHDHARFRELIDRMHKSASGERRSDAKALDREAPGKPRPMGGPYSVIVAPVGAAKH